MQRSMTRDFIVGLFLLVGLATLGWLSVSVGGLAPFGKGGFRIYADFDETGGLKPRSQVSIAGVKVGEVEEITLNEDYRAHVLLNLQPGLELPIDTSASIVTAGVLGDRYVLLQPGGDVELLQPGETLSFTESAVLLERLIGKLIHNADVEK